MEGVAARQPPISWALERIIIFIVEEGLLGIVELRIMPWRSYPGWLAEPYLTHDTLKPWLKQNSKPYICMVTRENMLTP